MDKKPDKSSPAGGKPRTDADYEVGYQRPPKTTRFKKGQPSANPAGRPRGRPKEKLPLAFLPAEVAALLKVSNEKVHLNGEELSTFEAAIRRLAFMGITQQKERPLMAFIDAAQAAGEENLRILQDHFAKTVEYKEKWGPIFAKCEAEGRPAPNIIPHPDDLRLCDDWRVEILGAVDFQGKQLQDEAQKRLSDLMKTIVTTREHFGHTPPDNIDQRLRQSERLANKLNKCLPPRLRIKGVTRKEAIASGLYDKKPNAAAKPEPKPDLNSALKNMV